MTWLAWRQLRSPAAVAALGVLGVLVALALTGPHLLNVYDTVVVPCAAHGDCSAVTAHFQGLDSQLVHLCSALMNLAPVLFGIFLGAPLIARELEAGTYRLAWTQSVTRTRWIATRLALVTLVTAVLMALLSTAVTWWQRPLDLVNGPLWNNFDQRDVVPVAYALFAVALGALLGAIARRTLVAMAGTIAGYFGVRYLVWTYVRRNLFSPLRASSPFHLQLTSTGTSATIGPPQLNDLVVSNQIVTGTGRVVGQDGEIGPNGNLGVTNLKGNGTAVFTGVGRCPNRIPVSPGPHWHTVPATQAALQRCVDSFHLREVVTYQPVSRYWPLQWSEAAIFVVLAVALAASSVWWVRRRLP
ncbi:MAG: ABC transporter permease [Acidimicrobiales bacterium]